MFPVMHVIDFTFIFSVLQSAPGDAHPWPGVAPPPGWDPKNIGPTDHPERNAGVWDKMDKFGNKIGIIPGTGNIHSWFDKETEKSISLKNNHVAYCPIQVRQSQICYH